MLVVFLVFIIIVIVIIFSTLRIEIKEFELINKKINNFQVIVSLSLFNKYKWIMLKIDDNKTNKLSEKIKKKIFNKLLKSRILTQFKNVNILLIKEWREIFSKMSLEKLNFIFKLGTEDASTTAYTIGIISAILGIVLSRNNKNIYYLIEPIYSDNNQIYLSLDCILSIKLVHINFRRILIKRRVYQKNGITSNRRINANSHG